RRRHRRPPTCSAHRSTNSSARLPRPRPSDPRMRPRPPPANRKTTSAPSTPGCTASSDNVNIAVINGPNLNLLGGREPERYGTASLAEIERRVRGKAGQLGVTLASWVQSNHEGPLVDAIQALRGNADGALINAAAFTHTSLAIRDAVLAVQVPFVE